MRRIRALPAAWLEQLCCRTVRQRSRSRSSRRSSAPPVSNQLLNSLNTPRVEAGISQFKAEQVLPIDTGTHGLGGLSIREVLAELQDGHEGEAPRGA